MPKVQIQHLTCRFPQHTMISKIKFLFAVATLIFIMPAHSKELKIGAGLENIEIAGEYWDLSFEGISLSAEYAATENVGFTAVVIKGINDDQIPLASIDIIRSATAELDYLMEIYAFYSIQATDELRFFVKAGYTNISGSVDTTISSLENALDQDGASLGLGTSYEIANNIAVQLAYTHTSLSDNEHGIDDVSRLGLSVSYSF